jgi:hypothetical protein
VGCIEHTAGVPVQVAAAYVQPVCVAHVVELRPEQAYGVPLQLGGTVSAHAQPG